MKKLPLRGKHGEGLYAIVDDADYSQVCGYRWHCTSGYAARGAGQAGIRIRLHTQLMKPGPGLEVDHKNGDKLDNRRANLRVCTHQQNVRNAPRLSASGYRGVHKVTTPTPTWYAHIAVNGKKHYLGSFDTAREAAVAYNSAATELHGEFALLNRTVETIGGGANLANEHQLLSDHVPRRGSRWSP